MFTTFDSLCYTKRAAAALFGGFCERLEVWTNCVWVKVLLPTGKALVRFVSKRRFLSFFAASRQERAANIKVTQSTHNSRLFTALSSQGDKVYSITVHDRFLSCSCEDFRNQCKLIPEDKPKACKHIYAVLNYMGYATLHSYVNRSWDSIFRS
jgi:hypothetical protein